MRLVLYLTSILLANYITSITTPAQIWGLLVPWGSWLIGATFILRDLVHQKHGRAKVYLAIATALAMSAGMSVWQQDMLPIALASAAAFLVSEVADTEVFARGKASLPLLVFYSGVVGGTLDSAIFVILGLSPLGAGILPWQAVPAAIAGQLLVKTMMQGAGALAIMGLEASK